MPTANTEGGHRARQGRPKKVSRMKATPEQPRSAEQAAPSRLRFAPELEQEFRDGYSRRVLPGLRGGLLLQLGIFLLQNASLFGGIRTLSPPLVGVIILSALLLASLHPRFPNVWQPSIVATFCVLDYLMLLTGASQHPPPGSPASAGGGAAGSDPLLLMELVIVVIGFVLTRLLFAWFAAGCLAVAALQVFFAVVQARMPVESFLLGTGIFVAPSLAALMFVTYMQEQSVRGEFLANHRLALLHADERQKREQTEGMLSVLNQAVGGIVHDLGNPLTSVQVGAETLRVLLEDAVPEPETQREMLDIVSEGAQMLDYLRVSLLEQTRALEGKPIPLELAPASVRRIVSAGIHFQKPKFSSERKISMPGDDLELTVDPMKMTAVFMNLIGNALKYSDGEIQIVWRGDNDTALNDTVLIGVLDQGRQASGLSQSQARRLFAAFSRLEEHAATEGTGLGLLSARKIVEAHGGEAYIEGYADGTPLSPLFSTAEGRYPSLLSGGFYTAFVIALPLSRVNAALVL